jgi:4'-phosphopantetheinyl transferase
MPTARESWDAAGGPPGPAAGTAEVWRIPLDLPAHELAAFEATLDAGERARAARFHFERDRRRWVAARGAMRVLLGRCADLPPERVAFRVGTHGKPALADAAARGDLRFNLSHAGGLALCALARGAEVGVDVEVVRAAFATDEIARRFFAPAEVAILAALHVEERVEAFFACWTRKEAYLKARGMGLALGLDRFEVSLAPGQPAVLLATRDEPAEAARWALESLSPGPGYAGALAVEGRARVAYRDWPATSRRCDALR